MTVDERTLSEAICESLHPGSYGGFTRPDLAHHVLRTLAPWLNAAGITEAVSLDALQLQVGPWVDAAWPGESVLHAALGVGEECGEVHRAVLKREHGTRGTYEQWTARLRQEAGDTVIALLDVARREGWSLLDAVAERWAEVSVRDLNHDPIGGAQ